MYLCIIYCTSLTRIYGICMHATYKSIIQFYFNKLPYTVCKNLSEQGELYTYYKKYNIYSHFAERHLEVDGKGQLLCWCIGFKETLLRVSFVTARPRITSPGCVAQNVWKYLYTPLAIPFIWVLWNSFLSLTRWLTEKPTWYSVLRIEWWLTIRV